MGNIDIFNRIAAHYDDSQNDLLNQTIIAQVKSLVRPHTAVLDFGCGTGTIGLAVLEQGAQVTFVDPASNMLDQVNQKLARIPGTAKVEQIDLEDPSQEITATFDLIIVSLVLLHISDPNYLVGRLSKLLNPQGQLAVFDFRKNPLVKNPKVHNGFNRSELESMCKQHGLQITSFTDLLTAENIFMGQQATLFGLIATR